MEVWIVRHAVAEESAPHGGSDFDRRLTERGKERFREFADWLVSRKGSPVVIASSPLVRALQTAELLSKASDLKKKDVIVEGLLGPGLNSSKLLSVLKRHPAERVAIVGHQPDMARTTAELIGGGQFDFGKGHVACIDFESEPQVGLGALRWFVGPE